MNLNFKGTRLLVSEFDACVEFYHKTFGFELIYQDKSGKSGMIGIAENLSDDNLTDNIALIFIYYYIRFRRNLQTARSK